MKTKIPDDGAAFPSTRRRERQMFECINPINGISLRDWFAGQALSGMLAGLPDDFDTTPNQFAKAAYLLADTMLKERDIKRE